MISRVPSQHIDSYYAATAIGLKDYAPLAGDVSCDVCVIGGGFTGLSSALHLAERGYDVKLIEAERISWGASGRNGGQLSTGQRKDVIQLEKIVGREDAKLLWGLAEEAKATVRGWIASHKIACDLKPGVLTVAYKRTENAYFEHYVDVLKGHYAYPHIRVVSGAEVAQMLGTKIYYGGELDNGAGHLHPLNYALGLARAADEAGAQLFENSRAKRIQKVSNGSDVYLERGKVHARYVVVACNGYLGRLEPRISGKIMPINNFILATEPLGEDRARSLIRDDVAVQDTKFVIDYYRLSTDHRLLFGGGENYTSRFPADIKRFVRKYMLRVYPQLADARIDYAWGGTLAVTMNRLPTFGRLEGDVYYAQGYSGSGVALASMGGKLVAEAIAGTAERFDVFARIPQRKFPGGTLLRWPGLALGMLYYALRDKL
ncbi:MAG: FAD-binding oxidoreductase [Acidiferrobacterales bacterium]